MFFYLDHGLLKFKANPLLEKLTLVCSVAGSVDVEV